MLGCGVQSPPHRGPGTKQRVHGCGCICAGPRCVGQSPHWEHDREDVGGAHQEGNSSSQRCCRPSCHVGCHRWTSTSALDHPATVIENNCCSSQADLNMILRHDYQKIVKYNKNLINACLKMHLVILVVAGLWHFISLKHLFR